MWECVKYLAFIGIVGFFIGRLIPKAWMQWNKRPFRIYNFEEDGQVYNCLKIRAWQDKIPDMSKLFTKWMPPKRMPKYLSEEAITLMLQETCIAELIHAFLCLFGIYSAVIWPCWGGVIVAILYFIGNLPFILVQRYNRPKLRKLLQRIRERTYIPVTKEEECKVCES